MGFGRLALGVAALTVLSSTTALHGDVQGAATVRVSGIVTDARTDSVVAGVQITIPRHKRAAMSRSDGRFLMLEIPEGEFVVFFERPGCYYKTSVEVAGAASEIQLDIGLPPEGRAYEGDTCER